MKDKIDTQGMTGPSSTKEWKYKDGYPPLIIEQPPMIGDILRKELKELINEVLDERVS